MAKNQDKSGHFNNFPAQAVRILTKSGQILRISYTKKRLSRFFHKVVPLVFRIKSKIRTGRLKALCELGSISMRTLGITRLLPTSLQFEKSHCKFDQVHRVEWEVPIHKLNKGLMAGVKLDVFFPGFPTLNHIRHTARMAKTGVKVFEQTSRGKSMMLTLQEQGRPEVREVARALLGSEVWVGWPHLVEAKVVAVQSSKIYIDTKGEREVGVQDNRQGDG
jgi:hypothetical protein